MVTPLGKAILFFKDFGLFDIVLPFLLVFTLVFAILEKTMILGKQKAKIGDKIEDVPNKNLNAMVAFVVGLLVVATDQVVTTINKALPNIVLLIVVSVSFLMLIGIFIKTGELEFSKVHSTWYKVFLALMFVGVIIIFSNSIYLESGESWFEYSFRWMIENWGGAVFTSLLFAGVIIGAIYYITKSPGKGVPKSEEEKKKEEAKG